MHLTIVTTLYRSAGHLAEFHRRVSESAAKITDSFDIVLVNDGSPDDSQRVAEELAEKDPRVTVIELSRNFGHHKAIMTGLAHATGDWVFLVDCDLEEPPELLERFYEEANAEKLDVVYGVQEVRRGALFERWSGALFYWLMNKLSTFPVPRNLVTVRIMRQAYVHNLVQHKDQELFLAGLWAITGFRQRELKIKKLRLTATSYTLSRKIWNLVNAVTSFSTRPLTFIFLLGCGISLLSGTAGMYLVIRRLFFGALLEGWASLIVSIWFLGGLSIFSLGIIGIYLSKVFIETKPRPYTVIRSMTERKP
jgi:putative glycosyltransferase